MTKVLVLEVWQKVTEVLVLELRQLLVKVLVLELFPQTKAGFGFLGISQGRVWRPKVYVRNPNYPRVTAVGCYFVEHSGGYQLIHTNTNKYLGHYTMAAISELEKKYAKKKRSSRNRKRK